MNQEFLKHTSIIEYSTDKFKEGSFSNISEINLISKGESIKWLNTYGINHQEEFQSIIQNNKFDDFLNNLMKDEDLPNKVIELENLLFIAIRVLKPEKDEFESEQIMFVFSLDFIWTIQEEEGAYFDGIIKRLKNNIGVVRNKKADYLLFLFLDSIIDNYQASFQKFTDLSNTNLDLSVLKPTAEFTSRIEKRKEGLFIYKKAAISLRNTITNLEKVEIQDMKIKYFNELKEQANNLIADIDFELQKLESKINLIFSIQGDRLNNVMKILTVFSVIFIPLTFIAGIYGMNFINMPETQLENGYYIMLGIMLLISLLIIWYMSKKKWF